MSGAAGWRPLTAFAAVAVAAAGAVGTRSVVHEGGDPRIAVVAAMIVFNLAVVGFVLLFASAGGRPGASDFGLRRPPLVRAVGVAIAVVVATYVLSAAWVVALGLNDDSQNVVDRLDAASGTLNTVLVIVLLAVATPLHEEFLFRGYFYRALTNWRGVWPAVLVTTIVFTATHVGWTPLGFLFPVAVFGLGLNLVYVWTRSLYPGLAMHALLNSVSVASVVEGWQLPLAIVFSVTVTLAIARLIARGLGGRAQALDR